VNVKNDSACHQDNQKCSALPDSVHSITTLDSSSIQGDSAYRQLLDALNSVASPLDYSVATPSNSGEMPSDETPSVETIVQAALCRIKTAISLDAHGMLQVDGENQDFVLTHCNPSPYRDTLQRAVEICINDGTFAWAISQSRAIVVQTNIATIVLHTVATRDRVLGMYAGITSNTADEINDVSLNLLSVVLHQAAYAIESSELNQYLEEKIATRTEQLEKAKEQAEAANRAKSGFLSTMSHEIRTPLNGMVGMLSLLQTTQLNNRQQEFLDTALNSCDNLLLLINDILDFSKIEAGKLTLEQVNFDPLNTIESSAITLAEQAYQKGLELIFELPASASLALIGDPTRLNQIIINLVGNAIKFTAEGTITVSAKLMTVENDHRGLYVEVRDTGIGIDTDAQQNIFNSFSQADDSTTRRYGGTGLGLAICKKLATAMGGKIGINSESGKGSTFWFTAYFKETKSKEVKSEEPTNTKAVDALNKKINDKRLLVVEGQNISSATIRHQLTGWGIRYSCVDSADNAIEAIRDAKARDSYNTVIADTALTGLDKLISAIKKEHTSDGGDHLLKLILLEPFGHASLSDETKGAAVLTLSKPIIRSKLFDRINQAIGTRSNNSVHELNTAKTALHGSAKHALDFGANILVVEDNDINQRVIASMLGSMDCEITIANNGQEAVELFTNSGEYYDLIFMDCQMPIMDGYAATIKIRNLERAQQTSSNKKTHIPIIALTANALNSDAERCFKAGMDDFVTKPYTPKDIQNALSRWQGKNQDTAQRTRVESPADLETAPTDHMGIDEKKLLTLYQLMGDAVFSDLIKTYLERATHHIESLERCTTTDALQSLKMTAHTLKGSSANIGAEKLAEQCSQLEIAVAQSNDPSAVSSAIAQIATTFEQTKEALEEFAEEQT